MFFFFSPSVYLNRAVPQWNQSYFTPLPPCTTCCCTKKGLRWRCVLLMACSGWFRYWKRVTRSSWPSLLTVCSSCPMAIRRARWGKHLDILKDILVNPLIKYRNILSTSPFLSADYPSQWGPRGSGVHNEELQLWEASVDHQPGS